MSKQTTKPHSKSDDSQFEIANRLFFRLYQSSNLMHKNGSRYVADYGTTTQQWAVLGALAGSTAREKGMTVKQLIELLLLSRQNLTSVLDRIEAREWIERIKDPDDGRNRLIRLTAEGERVWARMQKPIQLFYSDALATLSAKEQKQLYQLLDKLTKELNTL